MADYPPGDADAFARYLERKTREEHRARQQQAYQREEDEHYDRAFAPDPQPNGQYANGQSQHIPKIEPLDTIRASSWHGKERPVREWLDGRKLYRVGFTGILTGAGAVGKTLLALQASVACVTGMRWLGTPIKQGPVIFYSAEEPVEEMHLRVDEICEAEGIHLNKLGDLHVIDLNKVINAALIATDKKTSVSKTTDLFLRLDKTMSIIQPVCVWLDNRSLIVTGNENDRDVASFAMRQLQLLAEKHRCAIIMLAHPSQAGENSGTGASGSTGWFNTTRSVVYMSRPKDEDGNITDKNARVLENNKPNYSQIGNLLNLKWEFNRFLCTDPPPNTDPMTGLTPIEKAERVFLKLLDICNERREWVTHKSRGVDNYAPKVFDTHPEREKVPLHMFKKAMANLLYQKRIVIVETGTKSRTKYHLISITDSSTAT